MTVRELITELERVEDQNATVITPAYSDYDVVEVVRADVPGRRNSGGWVQMLHRPHPAAERFVYIGGAA